MAASFFLMKAWYESPLLFSEVWSRGCGFFSRFIVREKKAFLVPWSPLEAYFNSARYKLLVIYY
jgi:hypothetical protein